MMLRGCRGRYCRSPGSRQSDLAPSSCLDAWRRTRLACEKGQTARHCGFRLAVHSVLSCHCLPVNEIASFCLEREPSILLVLLPIHTYFMEVSIYWRVPVVKYVNFYRKNEETSAILLCSLVKKI